MQTTLYDLKQFSWTWYQKLDMYFISNGFTDIEFDSNLYIKHVKDGFTILVVYVDDGIVVGNNNQLIEDFK